jgi:hypothetical protein
MFVGQGWRTSTHRAPAAPIPSWGSLCKEDAGRLIIGERDGDMPKPAAPRPAIDGRQPPRLTIEANKLPIRGAYLAYRSLFQLKFELLRLFTLPRSRTGT